MSMIRKGTGRLADQLLESDEPSIRLQVRLGVQDADEAEIDDLRQQVRSSIRVVTLLSERRPDGTIDAHPYRAKWYGAHWVLVTLAELGCGEREHGRGCGYFASDRLIVGRDATMRQMAQRMAAEAWEPWS